MGLVSEVVARFSRRGGEVDGVLVSTPAHGNVRPLPVSTVSDDGEGAVNRHSLCLVSRDGVAGPAGS